MITVTFDLSALLSGFDILNYSKIVIPNPLLEYINYIGNIEDEMSKILFERIENIREQALMHNIEFQLAGPVSKNPPHYSSSQLTLDIIQLAYDFDAELITANNKIATLARVKGIKTRNVKKDTLSLPELFDDNTMSVHIKPNTPVTAKKGTPGNWNLEYMKLQFSTIQVINIAEQYLESIMTENRKGSIISQQDDIRIVVTRPPFSHDWEITATKPVKVLNLEDYNLSKKLSERIKTGAEGIVIAGSPGDGKTTFARALALYYLSSNKIVKSIQSPRDLNLPKSVTQLSPRYGSKHEIRDVVLLSRPDYTIFDEMRNSSDFKLFSDLRLSGVGMVGVVHATRAIDAVQRFIGKIDLGLIPNVIDTLIFIKEGKVSKVLDLTISVKIPLGMHELDLARPVVSVKDFESNKPEFEIYTFGDSIVVVPIEAQGTHILTPLLERLLKKSFPRLKLVDLQDNTYRIIADEDYISFILSNAQVLKQIEKEYHVKFVLYPIKNHLDTLIYHLKNNSRYFIFQLTNVTPGQNVEIYLDTGFLMNAKVGKNNEIRVIKDSAPGREILYAIESNQKILLKS